MTTERETRSRFKIEKLEERIAPAPTGVVTPADTIHPNIHTKVGQGDAANASPTNANGNGDQIHGIDNVPGQQGNHPSADGTDGFANELENVHGGIGAKNKNA